MYANVNGIKLFFDVEGTSLVPVGPKMVEMPTLLILHGGPGCDHSYFRPWLSPLTSVAQLVYIDHRGNGRSERTDEKTYTMDQMADDIEALRKYLGLGKVMMLGHSFGGMVAQTYALKYPDSLTKLVLAATTPSSQFWDEAEEIAQVRATEEQKAILNSLFEGRIQTQEEHDAWWRVCMPLYFEKSNPDQINEELERMIGAVDVTNYMMKYEIPKYDVRSRLPEITVPTLVLAGRHDWVTPVSQSVAMHEGIPNSKLVIMEDSGARPPASDARVGNAPHRRVAHRPPRVDAPPLGLEDAFGRGTARRARSGAVDADSVARTLPDLQLHRRNNRNNRNKELTWLPKKCRVSPDPRADSCCRVGSPGFPRSHWLRCSPRAAARAEAARRLPAACPLCRVAASRSPR